MFDDNGRHVGTVVTREPEWDDAERAKMLALFEYESSIHNGPGECGLPDEIARSNPHMEPVVETCPMCADRARNDRVWAKRDQDFEKRLGDDPAPEERRPSDGRHEWFRLKS